MQIQLKLGLVLWLWAWAVLSNPTHCQGGKPLPPQRHPPERRQANMLMLRFQDALAEKRWSEALGFCSDRVRAKASEWPSPGTFFQETIPVERLLAQDFGCCYCS